MTPDDGHTNFFEISLIITNSYSSKEHPRKILSHGLAKKQTDIPVRKVCACIRSISKHAKNTVLDHLKQNKIVVDT